MENGKWESVKVGGGILSQLFMKRTQNNRRKWHHDNIHLFPIVNKGDTGIASLSQRGLDMS